MIDHVSRWTSHLNLSHLLFRNWKYTHSSLSWLPGWHHLALAHIVPNQNMAPSTFRPTQSAWSTPSPARHHCYHFHDSIYNNFSWSYLSSRQDHFLFAVRHPVLFAGMRSAWLGRACAWFRPWDAPVASAFVGAARAGSRIRWSEFVAAVPMSCPSHSNSILYSHAHHPRLHPRPTHQANSRLRPPFEQSPQAPADSVPSIWRSRFWQWGWGWRGRSAGRKWGCLFSWAHPPPTLAPQILSSNRYRWARPNFAPSATYSASYVSS